MLSLSSQLWAHDANAPQRGGQVMIPDYVTFELVNREDSLELFLLDDGIEMHTQRQTAKIKVKGAFPAKFIEMRNGDTNRLYAEDSSFDTGTRLLVLEIEEDGD